MKSILTATFKDHKESAVNINKKNDRVDADGKGVEDNKGKNENSAIDMKSVVDLDTNIVNPGEANKSVGDIVFAFSSAVGKGVGDANKGSWGVGKGVDNKVTHSFGRNVQSNKVFVSHSLNILPFHFITNFLFSPIG